MKDEDYAALLLQPLDTEQLDRPSRIDVAKAMRDGERHRRVRNWSAGAALTAALTGALTAGVLVLQPPAPENPQPALPPDPVVPSACKAAILPTDGAKSADVRGGDPNGVFLVGSTEPDYGGKSPSVLVWKAGELVAKVVPKGPKPFMWDINGSGIAVGGTDGIGRPYYYRAGKVSPLKGYGRALAINEAGVVAGDHEKSGQAFPQRWSSVDAQPELMTMPEGATGGRVRDIAEDGTIVTELDTHRSSLTYLWRPDGSAEEVKLRVGGKPVDAFVQPIVVRAGWLYLEGRMNLGSGGPAGPSSFVYRYHLATRTVQQITDQHWAAQIPAPTNAAGFMDADAKVFVGPKILDLPELVESGDDGFTIDAISDDATIVGGTRLSNTATATNGPEPVIWRCR